MDASNREEVKDASAQVLDDLELESLPCGDSVLELLVPPAQGSSAYLESVLQSVHVSSSPQTQSHENSRLATPIDPGNEANTPPSTSPPEFAFLSFQVINDIYRETTNAWARKCALTTIGVIAELCRAPSRDEHMDGPYVGYEEGQALIEEWNTAEWGLGGDISFETGFASAVKRDNSVQSRIRSVKQTKDLSASMTGNGSSSVTQVPETSKETIKREIQQENGFMTSPTYKQPSRNINIPDAQKAHETNQEGSASTAVADPQLDCELIDQTRNSFTEETPAPVRKRGRSDNSGGGKRGRPAKRAKATTTKRQVNDGRSKKRQRIS